LASKKQIAHLICNDDSSSSSSLILNLAKNTDLYRLNGNDFELSLVELTKDEVSVWLKEKAGAFDLIRFGPEIAEVLMAEFVRFPVRVSEILTFDCLVKKQSQFWPQCFYREALHDLIIKKFPFLDISTSAYASGRGAELRMSLSVAVQLGFNKIKIVQLETDLKSSSEEELAKLKRKYFSIQFEFISAMDLTLESSEAHLLLNSFNLENDQETVADLSFLNFLKPGGMVVDLAPNRDVGGLAKEALALNFSVVTGEEVFSRTTELICEYLVSTS
jgi:hypothetical protein